MRRYHYSLCLRVIRQVVSTTNVFDRIVALYIYEMSFTYGTLSHYFFCAQLFCFQAVMVPVSRGCREIILFFDRMSGHLSVREIS